MVVIGVTNHPEWCNGVRVGQHSKNSRGGASSFIVPINGQYRAEWTDGWSELS